MVCCSPSSPCRMPECNPPACGPQLTAIAPEYYETLAYHKSWTWVTWKFLSDPDVGPWTRMRRASRGTPASEQQQLAQRMDDKAAAMVRSGSLWRKSLLGL